MGSFFYRYNTAAVAEFPNTGLATIIYKPALYLYTALQLLLNFKTQG